MCMLRAMTNYKEIVIICILLFFIKGIYDQLDTFSFFQKSPAINNRDITIIGTFGLVPILPLEH